MEALVRGDPVVALRFQAGVARRPAASGDYIVKNGKARAEIIIAENPARCPAPPIRTTATNTVGQMPATRRLAGLNTGHTKAAAVLRLLPGTRK